MAEGIQFKGITTRRDAVKVSGKLGLTKHPMVEHFRFLKANTKQTPKMTIPAPSALYTRSGRDMVSEAVYPSLDEFFSDLGKAYRKVVQAFADPAAATCSSTRSISRSGAIPSIAPC